MARFYSPVHVVQSVFCNGQELLLCLKFWLVSTNTVSIFSHHLVYLIVQKYHEYEQDSLCTPPCKLFRKISLPYRLVTLLYKFLLDITMDFIYTPLAHPSRNFSIFLLRWLSFFLDDWPQISPESSCLSLRSQYSLLEYYAVSQKNSWRFPPQTIFDQSNKHLTVLLFFSSHKFDTSDIAYIKQIIHPPKTNKTNTVSSPHLSPSYTDRQLYIFTNTLNFCCCCCSRPWLPTPTLLTMIFLACLLKLCPSCMQQEFSSPRLEMALITPISGDSHGIINRGYSGVCRLVNSSGSRL